MMIRPGRSPPVVFAGNSDSDRETGGSGGRDREPIVVCGGGAAGMAAAISAARHGAQVYLVEATARLGGTVAGALIHTLAGLFDSRGALLQPGLTAELVDRLTSHSARVRIRRMGRLWVLNVCPDLYRKLVHRWIAEEPRIAICLRSRLAKITRESDRVVKVEIAGRRGAFSLEPRALIDATGTAEVVRQIDPGLLQDGAGGSAAGLIFRMRGIMPGTLDFPRGAGVVQALRAAAADGILPAACGQAWLDTGLYPDEVFVKLFVPLAGDGRECHRAALRQACRDRAAVVAFLQSMPAFARARVTASGCLGIRDGGRVRGEYCLSGDDVRQLRRFEDAACRGCWPIEYWDQRRGVSLEYLPDGGYYEIPLRALRVKGLSNVWVAGKCLSADPLAHGSARAAGTCWAMGESVGKEAACRSCVREGSL